LLKSVIHINFSDSQRQKAGLKNVTNILKEEKEAEIEVVCHGAGIGLLIKDQSVLRDDGTRLMTAAVRFIACENSLKDRSIPKENLLTDVATVSSGAIEVLHKQQKGFSDFKP